MSLKIVLKYNLNKNIIRYYSDILTNKLYKGGPQGRSSFNGKCITIFGAYGRLGNRVIEQIGKYGSQIIIPHRCPQHDILEMKLAGDLGRVNYIQFDPYNIHDIKKSIQYSDIVINCIGNSTFKGIAKKSNIDVPLLIARAVRECQNVQTFIHVSSMSQCNHQNDYISKTKYIGERLVLNEYPKTVIVRPSSMYGMPDLFVVLMAMRRNLFFRSLIRSVQKIVKIPTSYLDVAKAIQIIAFNNTFHGKVFELYSKQQFYMGDIYNFVHMYTMRKLPYNYPITAHSIFWTLSKIIPLNVHTLAGVPPSFSLNDIPSKCKSIHTFRDLGIEPCDTEEGMVNSLYQFKPLPNLVYNGQFLASFEQPHLRLIPKNIRDIYGNI